MMLTKHRRIATTCIAALGWLAWGVGSPRLAHAGDSCFYRSTMYSDGAASCQNGTTFKCDDGEWKSKGGPCPTGDSPRVASRSCQFEGIAYSTGSASCQAGTQYRCEDGAWRNIGVTCPVGDSPIKIVPTGKTCMFDGATVANGSTMCRGGTTFLCNDGDWTNLGTLCR